MIQEGTTFDHDFYVVVGKQWRTENAYAGHKHNSKSLYKITLLLICLNLVMKSIKFVKLKIYFNFSKNIFGMLKT